MSQHTSASSAAEPLSAGQENPLILVVDDDAVVRTMAESQLGAQGFRVLTLGDGIAVSETFRARRPDAIILDDMLPDTDGFSLCRSLRQIPEAAHVPIVILTTLDDENAIQAAFLAGATAFVGKPVAWRLESHRLRYMLRTAADMRDRDAVRTIVAQGKKDWERTFDAIEDPVLLLGPDLTVRRANQAAARMGGHPITAMPGLSCADAIGCGPHCMKDCPVQRAIADKERTCAEFLRYGRAERDCLVSASPVFGGDGALSVIVYSIKDVTEHRALEKELLHAQKMEALGVLAAGIAHDFNNLLQGIMSWSDILSDDSLTKEERHEGLTQLSLIAEKGRTLTQQLLFTSRKGGGQKRVIALTPVIAEVASLLERTQPKSIGVQADAPPGLWCVHGDVSQIHQVLMNLAVNACQAMPEGGCLRLHAANVTLDDAYARSHAGSHAGDYVMIAISDTGAGIDKAILSRIYEPFFTTKRPGEGTGLGLSIVFGIVRDHGGHIACYSEQGLGTTFKVFLPCSQMAQEDAVAPGLPVGSAKADAGKTVLVAEDDPFLRGLIVRMLEGAGYEVVQTVNGQAALDKFHAQRDHIDAIVLDMNMPVMGGEECMRTLASSGCRVPIILASGALLSEQRKSELCEQAAAFVMKPFRSQELLVTLARALARGAGADEGARR